MERVPVTSSNVASVGYDVESATLEVQFQNEAVYRYSPVADADYRAIISGELSAGKFIASLKSMPVACTRICSACLAEVDPKSFREHACAKAEAA